MENRDFLNKKQYPYGYKNWCWRLCIELDMKDKDINTSYKQLCLDSWLCYFMDGLSPKEAVKEDLSNL